MRSYHSSIVKRLRPTLMTLLWFPSSPLTSLEYVTIFPWPLIKIQQKIHSFLLQKTSIWSTFERREREEYHGWRISGREKEVEMNSCLICTDSRFLRHPTTQWESGSTDPGLLNLPILVKVQHSVLEKGTVGAKLRAGENAASQTVSLCPLYPTISSPVPSKQHLLNAEAQTGNKKNCLKDIAISKSWAYSVQNGIETPTFTKVLDVFLHSGPLDKIWSPIQSCTHRAFLRLLPVVSSSDTWINHFFSIPHA